MAPYPDPPDSMVNCARRVLLGIAGRNDTALLREYLNLVFGRSPQWPDSLPASWVLTMRAHHHSKSRYRSTSKKDLERAPLPI